MMLWFWRGYNSSGDGESETVGLHRRGSIIEHHNDWQSFLPMTLRPETCLIGIRLGLAGDLWV